jgi:hypothetical protein
MYKSNSGLGSYSNRFCLILAILLSEKQVYLSATALIQQSCMPFANKTEK